mmetsp:Transcript_3075/g.4979  ORF Transcript_3075/g.4979 Transcript_3075/m.4979 type:complete len:388 (-) Transcript_3075:264-1427(-)
MATVGGVIATAGDVKREQAEARVIERRRRLEEERKQRIFDAKQRTIGIDKQAIDGQRMENNAYREMEHRRDQAFADRLLVTEQRVQLMERDVQRARKEATMSIQAYREQMQQRHMRKEWDLNDPLTLRKEGPARQGDDDPLCGPASLQKFAGEDLEYGNRVRKQQQQQATWVVEQMSERQAQIDAEREMERLFAERQAEIDERRTAMETEETTARSQMNGAVRDYNQALAETKRDLDTQKKMNDMEDAAEEIRNNLTSDLLTESHNTTISALAPHRFLKYHFKGFSDMQRTNIREEQMRQAAENQQKRMMEKEEEQNWDLVQEAVRRNLIAGEREVFRRKQELAKQTADEQKRQAEEARMRKEVLYKQVYGGAIDESFFLQFGTSSR